jgi:5-methylcytosine-specific restriction protein B
MTIPQQHEELLQLLLTERQKDPSFNFVTRKQKTERFRKGYWFQGDENYILVGLVDVGSPYSKTNCIGLHYNILKNLFSLSIVWRGVDDNDVIAFCEKVYSSWDTWRGTPGDDFIDFTQGLSFSDAVKTLKEDYWPVIFNAAKSSPVGSKILLSPEEFNARLDAINEQRSQIKSTGNAKPMPTPPLANSGRNYWMAGAMWDGDQDKTDDFVSQGVWINGYDDKYTAEINTVKPGDKIAIKTVYTRKRREGLPFENNGKSVACMDIKAIGTITRNHGDGKHLDVDWDLAFQPKTIYSYAYFKTFSIISPTSSFAPKLISLLFDGTEQSIDELEEHYQPTVELAQKSISSSETNDEVGTINYSPTNIIIYGPPGTGKTYRVLTKSLSIVEGLTELALEKEDRSALIPRYESYQKSGQITFTTFHQSFSYEEFIEGIRPDLDENIEGDIRYRIHSGIFKQIAERARRNYENSLKSSAELSKQNQAEQLFEQFIEFVTEKLVEGEFRLNDKVYIMNVEPDAFRYIGEAWNVHSSGINMKFADLKKMYLHGVGKRADIKDVPDLNPLAYQHATYFFLMHQLFVEFAEQHKGDVVVSTYEELKHFVVVIDEINRGNISKIFGELITLLEPDKRLGMPNELHSILPYSKDRFAIPPNLHMIGTMNTADRSIALMDTALRRRFAFEEMMPDESILRQKLSSGESVNLQKMLSVINQRITRLYDRDHTIGHAYFTEVTSIDDLADVMQMKIIPLLQEYFYDDWEKIRLVLGDNQKKEESLRFIVKSSSMSNKDLFGTDSGDFFDENDETQDWRINPDPEVFRLLEAYQGIYQ